MRACESILPGEEVADVAGKKKKNAGKKVITLGQAGQDTPAAPSGKKPKRAFKYAGRGAPKVYSDPVKLAKDCEKYFASISRVEVVTDAKGKPILNSLDKEVEEVFWLKKPSMGGLADFLGITDRTLRNYEQDESLGPVLEWAKGVCKSWLMDQVTNPAIKNVKGTIFVLENCYGMKEQVAVEHSGERIEEYLARLEAGAEGTEF